MKVAYHFICFVLLICSTVLGEDFVELKERLNDRSFKVRKAAFKEALALDFEVLGDLIKQLYKSDEPELNYVAEKLARKFKDLKKSRIISLPKTVSFRGNKSSAYTEFEYVNFELEWLEDDFAFKSKDVSLKALLIDGKPRGEDRLSNFSFYSRDRDGKSRASWQLRQGLDNVFPVKDGNYKVEVHFKTPETTWKVNFDFVRKCRDQKAALAYVKATLHKFFQNDLYRADLTQQDVKNVIDFNKKFPKSYINQSLTNQLNNAARYFVYYDNFNEGTRKHVCAILNEIGNVGLLKFIAQEEKRERRGNDGGRYERLQALKKMCKENWQVSSVLSMEIANRVRPFENRSLKLMIKTEDNKVRFVNLHRILLNGKERDVKSSERWSFERIASKGWYVATPPQNLVPGELGEHELTLFVSTDDKVWKLDTLKFKVDLGEEDREAVEFFKKHGLKKMMGLKDYDLSLMKAAQSFIEKFPKSYLKEQLSASLYDLVKRDVQQQNFLSSEERSQVAKVLSKGGFAKVMQLLGQRFESYRNSDSRYLVSTKDWLKLLCPHVKEAPKALRLKCQYADFTFKPLESNELRFRWDKSLKVQPSNFDFVALELENGEFKTTNFNNMTYSTKHKSIRGSKAYFFDKECEHRVTFYVYTGLDVFKFSNIRYRVVFPREDKELLALINLETYRALLAKAQHPEFILQKEHEVILDILLKYPKSVYLKNLVEPLRLYAFNDVKGRKTMSVKDRKRAMKYIFKVAREANLKGINHKWERAGWHNKKLLKQWMKALKDESSKAVAK